MPEPRILMPAPRLRFSELRRILTDLGFEEFPVDERHIWFYHKEADLPLGFPRYRGNAIVAPHHYISVRVMLDGMGILDQDDFDQLVMEMTVRHRATR